jgi:16S rRNA (guanine527-N7)-methyltransferase
LRSAVERCHFSDRFTVLHGRAEALGHEAALRGAFDGVVARSFGAPGVTAECAAPFLHPGGRLVVSEPPDTEGAARWPADGLGQLGLGPAVVTRSTFAYSTMECVRPCPDRFARRDGVPKKRPLF